LRGYVVTADYIITSSNEEFAEPRVLIPILKSICDTEGMTAHFNTLKSISQGLDSMMEEFSYTMKDLSNILDE
jgi:hypothetical protein